MTLETNVLNETFKLGRRAGQEDVCLEILKHKPSEAHKIARQFLLSNTGHGAKPE